MKSIEEELNVEENMGRVWEPRDWVFTICIEEFDSNIDKIWPETMTLNDVLDESLTPDSCFDDIFIDGGKNDVKKAFLKFMSDWTSEQTEKDEGHVPEHIRRELLLEDPDCFYYLNDDPVESGDILGDKQNSGFNPSV
jgi:hypothetical protein